VTRRVHRFGLNTSEIAIFPWNQGTVNSKRISGTFTHSCWQPAGRGGVVSLGFEMTSMYSAWTTKLGAW
jgi:hypothetical protein